MTELQPKAVTVAVKRLAGKASTLSLSHDRSDAADRGGGAESGQRMLPSTQPWKIAGPVEMTIEYLPQPPQAGRISTYRGRDVLEAYEAWLGK